MECVKAESACISAPFTLTIHGCVGVSGASRTCFITVMESYAHPPTQCI